jgi:polysaccharide export outer membrane protein
MRRFVQAAVVGVVLGLLVGGVAGPARGAAYVIGPEDVLQISVWLHPELERTVTVGGEGNITFPPLGDLHAAGQTTEQLATRVGDRLSSYLRQTATVTVTVAQYLNQSVYVTGAVGHAARYGFERIPGLLDVINQAGGALPTADLTQVQIIRREGDQRRLMTADVSRALREGTAAGLPELKPGDTILVPAAALPGTAPTTGTGDAAGVLGEVNRAGLYPVGSGADLWMVLAAAGGLTARGNLGDVRVVRPKEGANSVFSVNLRAQLRHGAREPFVVRPGDVVVVSGNAGVPAAWNGFTQLLAISRDLINIVVLGDYLKRNR